LSGTGREPSLAGSARLVHESRPARFIQPKPGVVLEDFERLGAFYLGKAFDLEKQASTDELVLYDSGDLTTHAVIIGMTGSGKTGLGIGILEEAALDKIPVIAIDPKGDIGNFLLTFPELDGDSFRPWVNPKAAAAAGSTVEEFADQQAALWKKGLADWGQTPERIRHLRDSVESAIFTPGSSAGIPISVLQTFRAPPDTVREDSELFHERIAATATGVLALLDIDADPLTSREHILVSNILKHAWEQDRDMDLPGLIQAIQAPPLTRIGIMPVDQFFPARDRTAFAMRINNLLAAPGFDAWMQGVPLDAQGLFYTAQGKPRVSVVSIAHLNDSERMFFVTMLLNEIISWMRRQPGTGSLRAVLYMDEIFGYLPPTANPAPKTLFLTLLKQARAYGLGLVLATQNPVDLDYRALSNAGTWFIGRLQTERDKARVMEGLEGAGAGGEFDKQAMERILAGLGKRRFLLHNVHEDQAVVFSTRWVMSYLAGPFTRNQIQRLMAGHQPPDQPAAADVRADADETGEPDRPVLAPGIRQAYLPLVEEEKTDARQQVVYHPWLLGAADVAYHSARHKVSSRRTIVARLDIIDGPVPVDWGEIEAIDIPVSMLEEAGLDNAVYAPLAEAAGRPGNFTKWERSFKKWLRHDQALVLYRSPTLKTISEPDETEGEFRARLQLLARERRDTDARRLREKYAGKISRVEKRVLAAQRKVDQEQTEVVQSRIDTALSVGSAILGAFMGRKRTSVDRAGSAVRKAGRMRKKSSDAALAEKALKDAELELEALNEEFEAELAQVGENLDAQSEELEPIRIRPAAADIDIRFFGIAWEPRIREIQRPGDRTA
jgi:hypothetical protein